MSESILESEPSYATIDRPPHVPEKHVVDFDYLHPDLSGGDVYDAFKRLHEGPDIKWTGRNGGHWIASRADDVQWVQENWEQFSHKVKFIPRGSVQVRMPPLTEDPPTHARYRAILNPFFTAARVAELAARARALTIRLVEQLKPWGHCDFVKDFAQVMPVEMFLGMVDLPLDRREELVEWAAGEVAFRASQTPNVIWDISGPANYLNINEWINRHGAETVCYSMHGGAQIQQQLERAAISDAERALILGGNMKRMFSID